jgi:hypothetical protein
MKQLHVWCGWESCHHDRLRLHLQKKWRDVNHNLISVATALNGATKELRALSVRMF